MRRYNVFNFYDQSRIVIDRVINQYPAADEVCEDDEEENVTEMPEVLDSNKAKVAFQKLAEAGVLDESFMPAEELSWSKKGELASLLAIELSIENTWKVFGTFWKVEPESLRSGYNKARNMVFKNEFDKQIMAILK